MASLGDLLVLYSKINANVEGLRLGKVVGILQTLTCFVKPLVDLTLFPHLGHTYDLNFIVSIISCRQD